MPCHDHAPEEPPTRVRFFTGQLLSVQDLETEQQYLIGMRKLHNRALHGWGVVSGLDVTTGSGDTVVVSPGLALDACGREVVVTAPVTLGLPTGSSVLEIVLHYREDLTDVTPGGEATRVLEGGEILAEQPATSGEDAVVLGEVDRTSGQAVVRPGRRRWVPDVPGLLRIIDELRERVSALEARLAEPTGQGTV